MEDDAVDSIGLAVSGRESCWRWTTSRTRRSTLVYWRRKFRGRWVLPEASVLQGLVASRAHASELIASSIHGLDTVRLDATGGSIDEEEEEFDGASIQLTDGNERRATVAETRVKHPCRSTSVEQARASWRERSAARRLRVGVVVGAVGASGSGRVYDLLYGSASL